MFIPPGNVFCLNAVLLKSGPALLNLNLKAAMRQSEGHVVIKQNLHLAHAGSFARLLLRFEHHIVSLSFSQEQMFAKEQLLQTKSALKVPIANVVDIDAAAFEVFPGLPFGRT